MNWYLKCLRQYGDFSGRAGRSEYWMFVLFNLNFALILMMLDYVLGLRFERFSFGLLYLVYSLLVFVPNCAVLVRRLHDIGKSGWMALVGLIPFIGGIWLFVLLVLKGEEDENEYGNNPKLTSNTEDNSNRDSLILFAVIWIFIDNLISAIHFEYIKRMDKMKYEGIIDLVNWIKPVKILLLLAWLIVPISLAFAIRDKSKRLVFLILGGLYFIEGINRIIYIVMYDEFY